MSSEAETYTISDEFKEEEAPLLAPKKAGRPKKETVEEVKEVEVVPVKEIKRVKRPPTQKQLDSLALIREKAKTAAEVRRDRKAFVTQTLKDEYDNKYIKNKKEPVKEEPIKEEPIKEEPVKELEKPKAKPKRIYAKKEPKLLPTIPQTIHKAPQIIYTFH
tara:strand:+ start:2046 stop:2528 length:483 start_codon:yes stop_codon:yes gene_type:complete